MSWSVSCVVFIGMKLAPPELFKVLSDIKPLSKSASVHRFFLCISLLVLFASTGLHAQWSTDPNNNLIVGYGLLPEMCSDSAGGAYVTYEVSSTYPRHIALRRLNRYGYQPWNTSIAIEGVKPESRYASLASDGQSGALIAFLDREWNQNPTDPRYNDRLRVQRVDSAGNMLWGTVGVRVSIGEHTQSADDYPAIVPDGSGGCVVLWIDTLSMITVQRLDGTGNRMWTDSGIVIEQRQTSVKQLVQDGSGGYILYIGSGRFHRFNSDGNRLWGPNGVTVDSWGVPKIVSDFRGGVILAGMNLISYNNGDPLWAAKCQHLDSTGTMTWGSSGLVLGDSLQNTVLSAPAIIAKARRSGVSVFEWYRRVGASGLGTFTQIMRPDGSPILPSNGIAVSTVSAGLQVGGQWLIVGINDRAIHIWTDNRTPPGIYAQVIDSLGQRLWSQNDVAVCLQSLGGLHVITDGNGGFILAGYREFDFSVRVQQVSKNGNLGEVITSVLAGNPLGTSGFELLQNYPNPFNGSTTIQYTLGHASNVAIEVYDILGQFVQTLTKEYQLAGVHQARFDAMNLATGVYTVAVRTPSQTQFKKMVYLK